MVEAASTLGGLFKAALEKATNGSAAIYDYGDKDDFLKLWGSGDGAAAPLSEANGKTAVIVVWDGRPLADDPKASTLSRDLTPVDWALAFSIKALGDANIAARANFHIHILDLTGKDHDTWAIRMRPQLLFQMPWVTLHAPLLSKTAAGEIALYRKGYRPLLGEGGLFEEAGNGGWTLKPGKTTLGTVFNQGLGKDLSGLARQWTATLIQSHDHHDLNNLIGPSIISGKPSAAAGPSILGLHAKLEWMGLLGNDDETGGDGGKGAGPGVLLQGIGPLDILAIDDELNNGWHGVLHKLLGLEGEASSVPSAAGEIGLIGQNKFTRMYGSTSPEVLSSFLGMNGGGNAAAGYRERIFDSPMPPGSDGEDTKPWALVLDLHLFSGSAERSWFTRLVEVAKSAGPKTRLAWPGFDDEIEDLSKWLNGETAATDSPAYDTALSLFPRLCALRWPCVPIIVFSGTGRRNLIAKLADYGNIFLASPKPNVLTGDARERIGAFKGSLQKELKSAAGLVKVQRKLVRLHTWEKSIKRGTGDNGSDFPSQAKHHHLTIAIDETGPRGGPTEAIGGVLLLTAGPNESEAMNASVDFQERLRSGGVYFYYLAPWYFEHSPPTAGAVVAGEVKNKGTNVRNELETVREGFAAAGGWARLGAFRYTLPTPRSPVHDDGAFSDEAYVRGLSRVVEIMLAEFLPSLGFSWESTTLSVWLPSKQSSDFPDPGVARRHAGKYDFRHVPGRYNLETIGGWGSAYSTLLRAVGARARFEKILSSIRSIKTRTIPYSRGGRQSALHWHCPWCGRVHYPREDDSRTCNPRVGGAAAPCNETIIADYSVLLHLADELVGMGQFARGYRDCLDPNFCFDVSERDDGRLLDFLQSARLFDRGLPADGFKLAYGRDFFLDGLQRGELPKAVIQDRLVRELAEHSKSVAGNTLIELAGLSARVNWDSPNFADAPVAKGNEDKRQEKNPRTHVRMPPRPTAAPGLSASAVDGFMTGTVSQYETEHGVSYGFIVPDGGGNKVHVPGYVVRDAGHDKLVVGQRVRYQQGKDKTSDGKHFRVRRIIEVLRGDNAPPSARASTAPPMVIENGGTAEGSVSDPRIDSLAVTLEKAMQDAAKDTSER